MSRVSFVFIRNKVIIAILELKYNVRHWFEYVAVGRRARRSGTEAAAATSQPARVRAAPCALPQCRNAARIERSIAYLL